MRFLKSFAAGFICAAMTMGIVPAFAAESSAENTFAVRTEAVLEENDFTLFGNRGESIFTGATLKAYNELKEQVRRVAAGEIESTVLEISDINWTFEELGLTASASESEIIEAIGTELNRLGVCLFYDCPYELYWCDKKVKTEVGYVTFTYDQTQVHFAGPHFRYHVAEAYQNGNDTSVNPEKVAAAKKAAENALKIVEDNADKTDREKLAAYREAICELVEYDHASAEGIEDGTVSYGDPWQMIYVFDGDENTNVVCEGYAKAFKYLCDMSEFDSVTCYIVTGIMTGELNGGDHMWNIVTLDGVNYFCDVTNTDVINTELFFDASEVYSSSEAGCTVKVGSDMYEYVYSSETYSLYGADILTLGTGVKGMSLSQSKVILEKDTAALIEAVFTPENVTNKNVKWESSDESIATVESGIIRAVSAGNAVITATTLDGGYSAQCEVIVFSEDEKAVIDSGVCGDNLTWVFDSDYVLTISGTGEMYDYLSADNVVEMPWSGWLVKKVVIEEGVTSVGAGAFTGKTSLVEVEMPSTLTKIGEYAFHKCFALETLVIPDSVTQIDEGAFSYCTALREVYLSSGMPQAGYLCFYGCTNLTTVHVPVEVVSLGIGTFYGTAVTEIYYGGTEEQWSAVDILSSSIALAAAAVYFTNPNINSVSVEKTDDAVVVTIDFDNPTGGSILAVGYGKNGEMVDMVTVSGNTAELSADTQSVKVFMWNSLSEMAPLCASAEEKPNN